MTELRANLMALKTTAGSADPVRLRYIEALLRRAERAEGPLAALLAGKVSDALEDYRRNAARQPVAAEPGPVAKDAGLRELVALLETGRANEAGGAALEQLLRQQESELVAAVSRQARDTGQPGWGPDDLRAAARLRDALVRRNADRVVTQALAEIPADCGPLNPQRLATRSLQTMRQLSPHYLSRFVGYIDTLFWLDNADRGKC